MGLTGNVPSLFPFLNPYMVEPSANQGATLKRVSEGFSHYGSEANNPAWPVHIPLCRICFHGTSGLSSILCTGKPAQFSLTAYVYAVLGVPLTQIGALVSDLMNSYRWTCNSDCDYGSKLRTVNATDYAAPQAFVRLQVADPVGDRTRKDYEAGRRTHGASSLCLSHHCLDRCPSK